MAVTGGASELERIALAKYDFTYKECDCVFAPLRPIKTRKEKKRIKPK